LKVVNEGKYKIDFNFKMERLEYRENITIDPAKGTILPGEELDIKIRF
jgi:hypothetical protein